MQEWRFRFEIDKNKFSKPFFLLVEELEETWNRYLLLSAENREIRPSSKLTQGILANLALSNIFLLEPDIQKALLNREIKKPKREENALINIIQGYRWIESSPISAYFLKPSWCENLNQIICKDFDNAGAYRVDDYWFGLYQAPRWRDCELLITQLCKFINSDWHGLGFGSVSEVVIKAIYLHVFLLLIRPFQNGNGRISRLTEFAILRSNGLGVRFSHFGAIFNAQHRMNYFRGINAINKSSEKLYRFIEYAYVGFLQELMKDVAFMESRPRRRAKRVNEPGN